MDKRTFIKLCSAAMTAHVISPLFTWASDEKLSNWAGNVEYSTENLYKATTVEQIQQFVRKQNKLKVLGTRHCFNRIADSNNQFISVREIVTANFVEPMQCSATYLRV